MRPVVLYPFEVALVSAYVLVLAVPALYLATTATGWDGGLLFTLVLGLPVAIVIVRRRNQNLPRSISAKPLEPIAAEREP
jgi:hypothetical protein